jgi:hypothetical protein
MGTGRSRPTPGAGVDARELYKFVIQDRGPTFETATRHSCVPDRTIGAASSRGVADDGLPSPKRPLWLPTVYPGLAIARKERMWNMAEVKDFSSHVEVLLHEEDACLHAGGASDEDLERTAPRVWRPIAEAGRFLSPYGGQLYMELSRQREQLFDEVDVGTIAKKNPWPVHPPHSGWLREVCPFCHSNTRQVRDQKDEDRHVEVRACSGCGWWESEDCTLQITGKHYDAYVFCRRGLLREFDISAVDTPLSALRRHLAKTSSDIRQVSPTILERLVRDILAEHLNCEVRHVGGPGDGGIDLLAVDADQPWAIQVKRRGASVETERVSAVREFVGALVVASIRRGIFVTTAPRFSAASESTATAASRSLSIDEVDLVDGNALASIMNLHPCRDSWEEGAPSLAGRVGAYDPNRRIVMYPAASRVRPKASNVHGDGEG